MPRRWFFDDGWKLQPLWRRKFLWRRRSPFHRKLHRCSGAIPERKLSATICRASCAATPTNANADAAGDEFRDDGRVGRRQPVHDGWRHGFSLLGWLIRWTDADDLANGHEPRNFLVARADDISFDALSIPGLPSPYVIDFVFVTGGM